jgi:hypothetical protein
MNKLPFLLILFFGMLLFFGCQKWSEPEFKADEWVPPAGTLDSQFLTIGKKTPTDIRHIDWWRSMTGKSIDSIVPPNAAAATLRYVRAVVVSSDEGGNYYKKLVIQDSTGGVELQLDMTGLFSMYPVGQKIILIPNGLVIGDYNNLLQVGWIYNSNTGPQVGRINSLFFNNHIIRDGLPHPSNLPKPLTNNTIDFLSDKDINKLVRLENVTFENNAIGNPFAFGTHATDWVISVPLPSGTTQNVTVRTSNFAKFRSLIIENRNYNLTGILTIFGTSYQLMIRTIDDIEALEALPPETIVFDFLTNPMNWEDSWRNESVLNTNHPWTFRTNAMGHIGNTSRVPMDDWFISPLITYPDLTNGYLQFMHQIDLKNGIEDPYQIYYTTSTASSFNSNDWKPLGKLNSFPASYDWSNRLSLSTINANTFRIAFRYYAPDTDVDTYTWNIRKVEIRNK